MEIIKEMTNEKMKEIYTNKKLRNAVAYAHVCCDRNGKEIHKKAMMYPINYKVTEKQIEEAKKEVERSRIETLNRYKNSLLFVGMGMTYDIEPNIIKGTQVGNYRIRTEFLNPEGIHIFVELGLGHNRKGTRCDYSINRSLEKEMYSRTKDQKHYYNYKNLERQHQELLNNVDYTQENILNLVNNTFDCNFKEIFIDNYDLSCDGILCVSPKLN